MSAKGTVRLMSLARVREGRRADLLDAAREFTAVTDASEPNAAEVTAALRTLSQAARAFTLAERAKPAKAGS